MVINIRRMDPFQHPIKCPGSIINRISEVRNSYDHVVTGTEIIIIDIGGPCFKRSGIVINIFSNPLKCNPFKIMLRRLGSLFRFIVGIIDASWLSAT